MIGWVKQSITQWVRGRKSRFVLRTGRDPARYEREKQGARSGDVSARMTLALNPRTHQEILYYMAQNDSDPAVRHAVTKNPSTPVQASAVIAADADYDVRLALVERLVRLLPELSRDEHAQLYAVAVQALGALAMDEVLNIRLALSGALKHHAFAPPAVVSKLARDVEREVAEPILKFCAALPDDVLLDILKSAPESWVVQAIAGRKKVSEPVSIAVIDTGDMDGGKILLSNSGADLGRELLMDIVERARAIPAWQEPLALRKGLPPMAARALAEFAEDRVRQILVRENLLDGRTTRQVADIVRRRLHFAAGTRIAREENRETPYDRAVTLARQGKLDDALIADALGMREEDFVVAAIACRAKAGIPAVRRILSLRAAKPIVALCWRAGLPMRFALALQQEMGRVPVRELIYPRDGTDYPFSEGEMSAMLDFLNVQ